MKAFVIVVPVVCLSLLLSACGPSAKEVNIGSDPGRVTELKNTEILVKRIGNTTIHYVGDTATKTCTALSERGSWWWGSNSVSIAAMPPEACGYPTKELKIEVVFPPTQPKVTTTPVTPVKKALPPPSLPTPCPSSCSVKG